jgi:hypothetical protein
MEHPEQRGKRTAIATLAFRKTEFTAARALIQTACRAGRAAFFVQENRPFMEKPGFSLLNC